MFEKFLLWIKRVMSKLAKSKQSETLQPVVSDAMALARELYRLMYENKSPWLNKNTQSLNLASAIASEIARLTTIELKTEITGNNDRAEYLNTQYQNFITRIRQAAEIGAALGEVVFKPYVSDGDIAVDIIPGNMYCPVAFDTAGQMTSAAFIAQFIRGKEVNTRLELHELLPNGYHISNAAYRSINSEILGTPIDLASVDIWADIEPAMTFSNITVPMYGRYKVPLANTVDISSPLGVAVYARAIELIREADKQFSRLLWEFEGGELAINADVTVFGALNDEGKPNIPKGKERLFRAFQLDPDINCKLMDTYSPAIRDESLINGLNQLLMRIEDTCGLARGTFSDPQSEARTATELNILKQRTYSTIADNQAALEMSLKDLVAAMDAWATIEGLAPCGAYELSFDWGDSIITDKDKENEKRLQEVAAGILKPEVYLAETRGISEEEALKLIPGAADVVEE